MKSANSNNSETLASILARCEGAYSDRTIAGYQNDLKISWGWCERRGLNWLPANSETLAAFLDSQAQEMAYSTVRRRLEAVKFAHRMLDQPSPAGHSDVRLALRRAMRKGYARPKQAHGITHDLLQRILEKCPDTLAGKRDAALISVGYDSLARSYELSLLEAEHIAFDHSSILIPRSKADVAGEGRLAYLAPRTRRSLEKWMEASDIKSGPLFQGLHTCQLSGSPMSTSAIRRLVKRAGVRAGGAEASGHSMRVDAAQDMMLAGLDHVAIMQAGGWKTVDVVARYVENAASKTISERRWQAMDHAEF